MKRFQIYFPFKTFCRYMIKTHKLVQNAQKSISEIYFYKKSTQKLLLFMNKGSNIENSKTSFLVLLCVNVFI